MGYRSQVALSIKNMKLLTPKIRKALDDCDNIKSVKDNDNNIVQLIFYWDSTKWYGSYEEVRIINKLVSDNNTTEDVAFLRIGDEDNDIERSENCASHSLNASISISFPANSEDADDIFSSNAKDFICK